MGKDTVRGNISIDRDARKRRYEDQRDHPDSSKFISGIKNPLVVKVPKGLKAPRQPHSHEAFATSVRGRKVRGTRITQWFLLSGTSLSEVQFLYTYSFGPGAGVRLLPQWIEFTGSLT